jgi:hypothetical protein
MPERPDENQDPGGARYAPRHGADPCAPLSPPWLEAMHERRDELARQLDGNLKQLKRVIDEAKLIAQQLEEVLEEIRTAGEAFTPERKNEDGGRGGGHGPHDEKAPGDRGGGDRGAGDRGGGDRGGVHRGGGPPH